MQRDDDRTRRPVLDSRGRKIPGLYQRGDRFIAGYREPGTGKWRTRQLDAMTVTAAKRERESLLAALREHRVAVADGTTWEALFEEWIAGRDASERTIADDRHRAARHLSTLNGRRVQDVTARDLARILLAMRGRYSEWTRYGAYRVAKATFALAVRRGLIIRSPADGLSGAEIPKQANAKRSAVLSAAQLDALIAAATTVRWQALFATACYAGLRQGEIRALRWQDVDLAGGVLRVHRSMLPDGTVKATKTAAGVREVPIVPSLRRLLLAWKLESTCSRPSDLVFGTALGKPLSERNIRRALDDAKKGAGLAAHEDRVSMHALRHSFLSLAATTLHLPDTTLARIAGHANAAITMRLYARDRRDEIEFTQDVLTRAAAAGFGR